ncbi:hypothetical protein H2198_005615 [Neophaeococcomyces mojaviensis]|uniref:Uncharacterized protein n=1 Tax=Neophaeococcomyces mojaviensis TaxID=3383035 RepID=A0ACC3A534_9EURO|nr:hypothetical protein H2198_005615 [Knufia sp. JES_112]
MSHPEAQLDSTSAADVAESSGQAPMQPLKTRAILVVIASFTLTLTACGLNFAFGVYQELYESLSGPFENATPAQIDLIGTLGVSLMTIGAPFASAWTKSYSPTTITLIGGFLFASASILASFSQALWQFVLTQGFLLGCGTCLAYIPAVTIAPSWFKERRGLAMGIVLSGTGVGGTIWAPVLSLLNDSIGFRNTLRLTGCVSFILITASGWILRWTPEMEIQHRTERRPGQSRLRPPLANWNIVRSRKFLAQAMGAVLQAAAYYTPVYFISTYARTLGYSATAGASYIALSNGTSALGKILLGYIADRLGRLNVLAVCTLMSALATFALWFPSTIAADGRGLFVAYVVLYSVTAGAYVSLFPTALVELFGMQHFASINGLLYMLRGIGTLMGTPGAGALIRGRSRSGVQSKTTFEAPSLLIGGLLAGATLGCIWVRIEAMQQGGRKWKM